MDYVLGIDQGATKTLTAIADLQGNILAIGQAPGGYHAVTGLEHAMEQIKTGVNLATLNAKVSLDNIVAVGAGLTGADFAYEYDLLSEALEKIFKVPNKVVNDCMVALRAESAIPDSMVICGGTGLNIGLWTPSGQEFVFGYYIDDLWQGGSSIGKRALHIVFEANINMCQETQLTSKVLAHFAKPNVESLMEWWYTGTGKKELKYLAPIVDECASNGDTVALNILKSFADGCSRYAIAGMRNFNMLKRPIAIYLSGSIFKSASSFLVNTISEAIHKENPQAQILNAQYEPVVGGIIIALEKAYGGKIPSEVSKCVHSSAKAVGLTRLSELQDEAE